MLLKFLSYPVVKLIPFLLFFLGMVFFLPNTAHFFSGAESNLLDSGFYQFDPNILIRYRMINLLILFGVLGALFFVCRALFGVQIALISSIILLTSSWVFLIGYWLSFDHLLGLYHSALILTLLFYTKKQSNILLGLVFILTIGSLLIDALGTTLFLSVLYFGALRQQKLSKFENYFWFPLFILSVGIIIFRFTSPSTWKTYLGIQSSDYVLFYGLVLMALWPFVGFIFAAMKDAISKWKKGDVWSIWMLTALFAGIISQSPAFILPAALLIGKHVADFDLENYPYKHIIKYWSTFLWVIWFFLSIFLMTGGHLFQSEGGFRMGFQLGFGIWLFGLISIVGMYGKHFFIMRLGLIGGNIWVTFSLFIILIPYFGNEFLLNNVWKFANTQKTNVEWSEKIPELKGLHYTLRSIQRRSFKINKIIIPGNGSQLPTDSIAGFSRYFKKETLFLTSRDSLRSDEIKQ